MRSFKLTLPSLTLSSLAPLLLLCSPAQAQSPGAATVQYVGEAPAAIAGNTSQGTDAVNDALAGPAPSGSSASASSAASASAGSTSTVASTKADTATGGSATGGSATGGSATGGSATGGYGSGEVAAGGPGAAGVASEEGLASITELPETGGAHPALPIAGALLVAAGLLTRRITAP